MHDADEHLAGEDAELITWLNGGPGTRETVLRHLLSATDQWAAGGPTLSYAITSATRSTLMGTIDIDLQPASLEPDQANLAYGLYPQWRHRGYATRAVQLAVELLEGHPHVRQAVIRTSPANPSSQAVAHRAGFRWAGTQPDVRTDQLMNIHTRDVEN